MKFRIFLSACICSLLSLYATHAGAANDTITIAPYGNSITQAYGDRQSYRYPLWKKLIDANIAFDFVGSMNTNFAGTPVRPDYKGKKFDPDHEGHWGWRADEILGKSGDNMSNWLTRYTPDMVLLHIGSNDCIQGQNVDTTIKEIQQIVAKLRTDNSKVVIFLASLIPCNNAAASVNNLNAKIRPLAPQLNTAASPVIFVDQNAGINVQTDLYDGIHPGPTGEEKMAQKWFDAIAAYLAATGLQQNCAYGRSAANPAHRLELVVPRKNSTESPHGSSTNLLGKRMVGASVADTKTSGVYIVSKPGDKR